MAYNDLIDKTDAAALIPEDVADSIFKELVERNPVFQLARRLPNMSRRQERMAVGSALAQAYFVNGDTGLAQTTAMEWENKYVYAEKLAAIIPVSKDVVNDSEYDIWGEAQPELIRAFDKTVCGALFNGINIPALWTTALGAAGLVALCTANSKTVSIAAFTDLYEAIMGESADGATDGLLMLLEDQGYVVNGHIAHPRMRGRLRNCRSTDGVPLFTIGEPAGGGVLGRDIDGAPVYFPRDGAVAATALDIAGDWSKLVYSIRKDITFEFSDQAVITDAEGKVVTNLFQQDMVALKATMRLGFALPNPVTPMATAATRCPFALLTA